MTAFGLIMAFNEEATIGDAVTSLFEVGCEKVVVADGAWTNPDGSYFGGGTSFYSTDATVHAAIEADAVVLRLEPAAYTDGGKRDAAIAKLPLFAGASRGDYLFLLDADEIATGRLDDPPRTHACVIHRDLQPNDLPGLGGVWPRGDYGAEKPLLRWLEWSPKLSCSRPGRYRDEAGPVMPYLVEQLRAVAETRDGLIADAYRVLRDVEHLLTPEQAVLVPIVQGVEIHHVHAPDAAKIEAKRRYYETRVAA